MPRPLARLVVALCCSLCLAAHVPSARAAPTPAGGHAARSSRSVNQRSTGEVVSTHVSVRVRAIPWQRWTQRPSPIFRGQYIASDPAVLRDGGLYRMVYTCYTLGAGTVGNKIRAALCEATSRDGLHWTELRTDPHTAGLILMGSTGAWDEDLESAFLIKQGGRYLLYYSGYRDIGHPFMGYPAALGLATSTDGVHFARRSMRPILAPTPGSYDGDAVYSPAITRLSDGSYVMIYAGHCYTRCTADLPGVVTLLAATSRDGITWAKRPRPVLTRHSAPLAWIRDGVAEPGILAGPHNRFSLYFTGLRDERRAIGEAVSDSPFGPWVLDPRPIILPGPKGSWDDQVLAPDVHLEGRLLRMWFLGISAGSHFAIGYAESRSG